MQRRVWRHGTVSAVGFGCMSFGGFYGPTNEVESMQTLARALDLGVDFWDTANVYGDGLCEQIIGKFLAEDKSRRARVTLATKFAIRRRDDGARFFDNSAAHIRQALDDSRKRLAVDAQSRTWPPSGLRGIGRDSDRLLPARARLFERPVAGR